MKLLLFHILLSYGVTASENIRQASRQLKRVIVDFFFFYSMMYFTFRDASSRTSKQTCLCKRCEKYSIYIEIIKISPNICSTKGQCKSQQKFQRSRLEEDVSVPACYFFSLPDGRFCFSYQRQASHLFIVLIIMSKNDCSVWFY